MTRSPSSLILVLHTFKSSSAVNEERHANPAPVIERQLLKLSLVSRVNEVEIARSPASLILVLRKFSSSRRVNDDSGLTSDTL